MNNSLVVILFWSFVCLGMIYFSYYYCIMLSIESKYFLLTSFEFFYGILKKCRFEMKVSKINHFDFIKWFIKWSIIFIKLNKQT